jgi:hypothetical protein
LSARTDGAHTRASAIIDAGQRIVPAQRPDAVKSRPNRQAVDGGRGVEKAPLSSV